jgi:hypothetical protein
MRNILITATLLYGVSFLNNSIAQDLSLVCKGKKNLTSKIGVINTEEIETYDFSNGKLNGIYSAQWSDNQILIEFPKNIAFNESSTLSRKLLSGSIIINRISGSVLDSSHAIMKNPAYGTVEVYTTFNGICEQGKKKF